ncbi:glycosyltransferase [Kibdelosporangium phytohabitans]|nr:glycosyltransferase [Kibdelosporangium phytohabitans]MBE1465206.1 UDP:flavonoid glycosyltransferase YjiC (YdhE family) [Kibdelosporangium phytohabitans]
MRVLLSTIGSRGEFEPTLALAARVHASGHEVRLIAPPDSAA